VNTYDPISLEILWGRLIAIVDEMATTLVRTAFSSMVREANDCACVLMDAHGNSLAQSTLSVPSFAGILPQTTRHFLQQYPGDALQPGDILVTNDPWIGAGHLPDLVMVVPVFYEGRLVAFTGTIAHLPDIGGNQMSAAASEVFEEGLQIPPCKLYRAGQPSEDMFSVIQQNVRVPEQVMGDIEAQITANKVGNRNLLALMTEEKIADLGPLAQDIHGASERAMRKAISEIPDGEYRYSIQADGFDDFLTIKIKVSIEGSDILVDYTGSSPQENRGINSVLGYTRAYTVYPLKCALDPRTPNNEGGVRPIRVQAPAGSILNPNRPAAVNGRALAGHLLPDAVFGALAKAIPDRVQAESGIPPWLLVFTGQQDGEPFANSIACNGGTGATSRQDGRSCLSFPTNVFNTPIEIFENWAPVVVKEKSLAKDSGGPGQYRGGCGQHFIIQSLSDTPIRVSTLGDRIKTCPTGIGDAWNAAPGAILLNGQALAHAKGVTYLKKGDVIAMTLAGGAGFGDPLIRDRTTVLDDVVKDYVSIEQAEEAYGVKIDPNTLQIKA
jgi:N-methylhydantoinase B